MSVETKNILLATALALASSVVFAQSSLVVSPAEAKLTFGTDYARLIETAYPRYDDAALSTRLAAAAKALESRPDRVTVRSLNGIERLLALPLTTDQNARVVDTAKANYRIDPDTGKAHAHQKNATFIGLPRERFDQIAGAVGEAQRRFVASLGLPADELAKTVFHEVIVQGTLEGTTDGTDGQPSLVRRGLTLAYRGFAGFPIEGSEARVSSYDAQRMELFSLSWPKFKAHPEVTSYALDAAANVKKAILQRVTAAAAAGDDLSVFMGVVFRPVRTLSGELVHVPAMKVVMTPAAKRIPDASGRIQTDGGLVFYANLLKAAPRTAADDTTEREGI